MVINPFRKVQEHTPMAPERSQRARVSGGTDDIDTITGTAQRSRKLNTPFITNTTSYKLTKPNGQHAEVKAIARNGDTTFNDGHARAVKV